MTILAIDPGVTTGVAISHDEGPHSTLVTRNPRDLWILFDKHKPSIVVYEDFNTPGKISKDGLFTVRLIGAIEVVCYERGIRTCLQYPHERYQFLTASKAILQATGNKFMEHQMDALAHLLVYEYRVSIGSIEEIMSKRRSNLV